MDDNRGDDRTLAFRVGIGHDTHRLEAGRPLVIGGVTVPHDRGPIGHSDGDVLLHAAIDALLGAAALGDIGELFPDTDPANRDRDSGEMLDEAYRRVVAAGWQVENIDGIVHLQRPKLAPHKQAIRENLARHLKIDPARVGIKAKTGEHVGPVGRDEAIVGQCVVLISGRATDGK